MDHNYTIFWSPDAGLGKHLENPDKVGQVAHDKFAHILHHGVYWNYDETNFNYLIGRHSSSSIYDDY